MNDRRAIPQSPTLLTNVTVLDPRDGSTVPRQDLLWDRGRIVGITPSGERPAHGAQILEGAGLTALPGLIDAHLHLCGSYTVEAPGPRDLAAMPEQIRRNLAVLVRSGVTTVRDMGAPLRLVRWLRGLTATGRLVGPRILASGPVLTPPGGYPAFMEPLRGPAAWLLGQVKAEVATAREAQAWVDRLAASGMDVVKVMFTSADYDDTRSPLPLMPDSRLRAITDRAHHHNLPVAVHQVWQRDLDLLLDLPFDTLEHVSIDAVMAPRDVARIRARNLPVTTTLMTYGTKDFARRLLALLEHDAEGRYTALARRTLLPHVRDLAQGRPDTRLIGQRVIDTGMRHMLESVRRLREAGATVHVGTDQGGAITPCGLIRWELESLQRAGFSALEALQAATCVPARVLGLPRLGWLAPGHDADLIATRGNPAEDLEALRRVELVVARGRVQHLARPS